MVHQHGFSATLIHLFRVPRRPNGRREAPRARANQGFRHGFCYIPVRIFEALPLCLPDAVHPFNTHPERPR